MKRWMVEARVRDNVAELQAKLGDFRFVPIYRYVNIGVHADTQREAIERAEGCFGPQDGFAVVAVRRAD